MVVLLCCILVTRCCVLYLCLVFNAESRIQCFVLLSMLCLAFSAPKLDEKNRIPGVGVSDILTLLGALDLKTLAKWVLL